MKKTNIAILFGFIILVMAVGSVSAKPNLPFRKNQDDPESSENSYGFRPAQQ